MALSSRASWVLCLAGIITAGILSRLVRTGSLLFDKYLGDALYAAMIYVIVRLLISPPPRTIAAVAMALVTTIELFQLTLIPARLFASDHLWVRLCARLLGTHFSVLDLVAYAVGITCIWWLEVAGSYRSNTNTE